MGFPIGLQQRQAREAGDIAHHQEDFLGLHLGHGLGSLLQTFGLHHESYVGGLRAAGWLVVATIVGGNATIPISVWSGWIQP